MVDDEEEVYIRCDILKGELQIGGGDACVRDSLTLVYLAPTEVSS